MGGVNSANVVRVAAPDMVAGPDPADEVSPPPSESDTIQIYQLLKLIAQPRSWLLAQDGSPFVSPLDGSVLQSSGV
jgi:hypothetical protein